MGIIYPFYYGLKIFIIFLSSRLRRNYIIDNIIVIPAKAKSDLAKAGIYIIIP
jgi:hypothetical protein